MSSSAFTLSLPTEVYEKQWSRLDREPGYLLRCDVVEYTDRTDRAAVLKLARACLLAQKEDDGASDAADKIRRGLDAINPPSVRLNLLNAVTLGEVVLLYAGRTQETGDTAAESPADEGLLVSLAEATRRSLEPYPSVEAASEAFTAPLPFGDIELLPAVISSLKQSVETANNDLFPVR